MSDAQRLARTLDVSLSLPPLTEEGDTGGSTAPPKTCPFLWRRVYIDMEANIVPCCSPAHIVAGNVGESTFREIWNGEFYARMRSTFAGGIPFDTCYECATSGYLSKISL